MHISSSVVSDCFLIPLSQNACSEQFNNFLLVRLLHQKSSSTCTLIYFTENYNGSHQDLWHLQIPLTWPNPLKEWETYKIMSVGSSNDIIVISHCIIRDLNSTSILRYLLSTQVPQCVCAHVPSTSLVTSAPALKDWKGRVYKLIESITLNKVLCQDRNNYFFKTKRGGGGRES